MKKTNAWKIVLRGAAFLLIFTLLFTAATLVYLPKRPSDESQSYQAHGFYQEPKNTLDVLYLGSCNMYSSVSPVRIYEKYGITGYAFACPDQEVYTSYYFLREALKRQDIKVVVLESLFLTGENNSHREYFNRYAVDYLPPSLNKIELAWQMSVRESEFMKQYDSTAPDTLLTFAGYMFPLLRYHSRNDFTRRDLTFFFHNHLYNFYKGGFPQYNYTTNDGNFFDKVFNGDCINETAREYTPKIKALCEENGIQFIIAKSPNYARWGYDDTHTKLVRDFAAELGVPFIDFHSDEYDNFEEYDYGYETGRLNVYGVRKFSDTLGRYITEELGLAPTELSEADRAAWDACVEKYYAVAAENGCSLYAGQIAQLSNLDGALCVRWNLCEDCGSYSVYRAVGSSGAYECIAENAAGPTYEDTDVVSGQGYSYYIVPNEGASAGAASPVEYYVYVAMPQNFSVTNDDGLLVLDWDEVPEATRYRLQRRYGSSFNFSQYDYTELTSYRNKSVTDGWLHYYRLTAIVKEDGETYSSMSTIVRAIPQSIPEITGISENNGKAVLQWEKLTNQKEVQIWRRADNETDFTLIDTVSGSKTTYTDKTVSGGQEYFYRIVSTAQVYSVSAESEPSNTVGVRIP